MSAPVRTVRAGAQYPASVTSLYASGVQHRQLVWDLSKRAVSARYRGSLLGIAWSLITPILMLAVYTFVFSVVFQARWGSIGEAENRFDFAMLLFAGLVTHAFLAEVLNRSTRLISGNANYVKKVVFPLEILPVVEAISALFQLCLGVTVLLVLHAIVYQTAYPTVLFMPVVLLPFCVLAVGLAWLFASVTVFVRDLEQVMPLLTMVLLFLAPIFYPITAVPEGFRGWIMLNPLTFVVDQVRRVTLLGLPPDWSGLAVYSVIAVLIAWLGYRVFQSLRRGFADVV
ncbi:MAG: ABC transporter permease [Pseudomonadota bacterium]